MKSKFAQILFSTRLMAILFLTYAIAMAVGTFLDAGAETSPTPYSRTLIYNAWWFEGIMILFLVNFFGNIFKYRLIQQKKWSTLLLHLSFVLILIGAAVTRYYGFEGMIPIKEGESNDTMLSERVYLKTFVDGEVRVDGALQRRVLPEKQLLLSEKLDNYFSVEEDYKGQDFTIEYVNFIEDAHETLVEDESGDRYYKIVEAGEGGRHDHYLKEGSIENIHNVLFAFNKPTPGAINISNLDGKATLSSPFEGTVMRMADQKKSPVRQDSIQDLRLLSLYEIGEMKFVLPEKPMKGEYKIVKAEDPKDANSDALTLKVSSNGDSKEIILQGGQGTANQMKTVKVGGLDFNMSYGSKEIKLPFSVKLNDIIAERYPGTDPSSYGIGFKSYESKVTVEDAAPFDARIYMNNVLDHKGYRFFQSQIKFSTTTKQQNSDPDITVLSVNHDFWGTWISYIGYFLLFLAMMVIMFDNNTRFGDLKKKLDKLKVKKTKLGVVLLLISLSGFSQNKQHVKLSKEKVDSIIQARVIPKDEAAKFGALLIQDLGGRIKPINTYAIELLRKVSKKDTYAGLDANQVMLSMIQNYKLWFDAPLIKLKRGNDSIRKVLELPLDSKYAALSDFYSHKGEPKINPEWIKEANETSGAKLNIFQKDIKRAYEDQRLLGQALSGSLINIYPVPQDDNNKWVSPLEISTIDYGPDSKVIKNLFPQGYFEFIIKKDYKTASSILDGISKLQKGYSPDVIPSDDKIAAELFYNEYDVFKTLFSYYMYAGVLMLVFLIFQIFYFKSKHLPKAINFCKYVIVFLFFVHLAGLVMRWYISGHAPWSDAYESMIYIGFATMLFGLLFGKDSNFTIASTAFVTSMILMIAHWNSIDPAISNLQPVLDSYWLMIHVSVIVGSYGPFTLAFVLGLVSLLLMILTTEKNKKRMNLNIQELTVITEQAITIGLIMLTIGNFLGGIWANESWGRYWGWDPKETWALISIFIYAFALHVRLIPGLRGRWFFNFLAVICFASILMTYFGVNFYLAGLHSYASGDVTVTPTYIYYNLLAVLVVGVWSYIKYKKFYVK